jgi:hypothetical protein
MFDVMLKHLGRLAARAAGITEYQVGKAQTVRVGLWSVFFASKKILIFGAVEFKIKFKEYVFYTTGTYIFKP